MITEELTAREAKNEDEILKFSRDSEFRDSVRIVANGLSSVLTEPRQLPSTSGISSNGITLTSESVRDDSVKQQQMKTKRNDPIDPLLLSHRSLPPPKSLQSIKELIHASSSRNSLIISSKISSTSSSTELENSPNSESSIDNTETSSSTDVMSARGRAMSIFLSIEGIGLKELRKETSSG